MDKLTLLLCGNCHSFGELSEILLQLAATIDDFAPRCYEFISARNDKDILAFGPYCGRTVLETACSIFIGRIDPYRLLLVKRHQEATDYDISVRHNISIQWSGDVISPEPPPSWKKLSHKNIVRTLFSDDYMGEIYWKQAFADLLNDMQGESGSEWLEELCSRQPGSIAPYMRTEAGKLYSSLSKGVHQEYVVSPEDYDRQTVRRLLKKTVALVAKMALITHYIPTALGNLGRDELSDSLKTIEKNSGVK